MFRLTATLTLLLAGACARMSEVTWSLTVEVSDGTAPVPGAQVRVEERALGHTDARGMLAIRGATTQARLGVRVRCPQGFGDPDARSVSLGRAEQIQLAVSFRCVPHELPFPVVVRAPLCAGCPVRIDGVQVGHIGERGVARFAVRRAPSSRLRIMIDTSQQPLLAPQHPLHELTLPAWSEVIWVAPSFSKTQPKRPRKAKVERARQLPYAIRLGE